MFYIKKNIVTILVLSLLFGCTNSNMVTKNENLDNSVYSKVLDSIYKQDLDTAADYYVKLKEKEDNTKLKESATLLAIAHIEKKEYILANFYIQEALSIDSNSEFLKYLLVKNQFLAANLHNRDQSYMQKALKALQSNKGLVSDSDYKILANTMLTRVKLDMAWNNKEVGELYKSMNKLEAYKMYKQKVENLGFNAEEIVKY